MHLWFFQIYKINTGLVTWFNCFVWWIRNKLRQFSKCCRNVQNACQKRWLKGWKCLPTPTLYIKTVFNIYFYLRLRHRHQEVTSKPHVLKNKKKTCFERELEKLCPLQTNEFHPSFSATTSTWHLLRAEWQRQTARQISDAMIFWKKNRFETSLTRILLESHPSACSLLEVWTDWESSGTLDCFF